MHACVRNAYKIYTCTKYYIKIIKNKRRQKIIPESGAFRLTKPKLEYVPIKIPEVGDLIVKEGYVWKYRVDEPDVFPVGTTDLHTLSFEKKTFFMVTISSISTGKRAPCGVQNPIQGNAP